MTTRRWWLWAVVSAGFFACGGPSSCACAGYTPLPQGSFGGEKLDSAGAVRLTTQGFSVLNQQATTLLATFAPGGQQVVPVPCSLEQVAVGGLSLATLAVADTGAAGCTSAACGRMDGRCDASDVGHEITLGFTGLSFAPRAPDILEARLTATVQTGRLPIASTSANSALCLFSGRAQFTVDLDTARAAPPSTDLLIDVRFAIDTRWDKLLSLEVAQVRNAQACSGSVAPPDCIDPNDMEILNEGCGTLNIANLGSVKSLLVNQLATSLRTQITEALAEANCATCAAGTPCPSAGTATSTCAVDAGVCLDDMTGECVPRLQGTEGRLDLAQTLGALGTPAGAALTLSLGAGGGATASAAGLTVGLRGGAQEVAVADCVAPATRPLPPALPLPDLDADAPGPYDVGVTVSQQLLSEFLFRAQQSGALCMELGAETVASLESSLLSTLLPSLGALTGKQNVPLRVVIRPVHPPTATVGAGTVDAMGQPLDPLLRLDWRGLELDVYALLEERMARLFTVGLDLSLPLSLTPDGCSGVVPAVGSLTAAVTNVAISNNELLAEPLDVLQGLVPSLLALAEPSLAQGFPALTLPTFDQYQLKLVAARGVGRVSGTTTFQHLGLYAELLDAAHACTPTGLRASAEVVRALRQEGDRVSVEVAPGQDYAVRVDGGFWTTWRAPDALGRLAVEHPRLRLAGAHRLEVKARDGRVQALRLE